MSEWILSVEHILLGLLPPRLASPPLRMSKRGLPARTGGGDLDHKMPVVHAASLFAAPLPATGYLPSQEENASSME